MWPDVPLRTDVSRLYEPDWCRRIPADAVLRGKYCSHEQILDDRRRHRCRLAEPHDGQHVCWCLRTYHPRKPR